MVFNRSETRAYKYTQPNCHPSKDMLAIPWFSLFIIDISVSFRLKHDGINIQSPKLKSHKIRL